MFNLFNKAESPYKWGKKKIRELKDKPLLLFGIIIIVLIFAGAIVYSAYSLTVAPARVTHLEQLTVSAKPQLATSDNTLTFPTDKSITVETYSKDLADQTTITLTSPGFKQTVSVDYSDYFYLQASTNTWYWNYLKNEYGTATVGGERAINVSITSNSMTIGTQFVEKSSIGWVYGENQTGLAGGGNTTYTVSEEFEMENYSAFKSLKMMVAFNSTNATPTSFDFDGNTYTSDDWNTTVDGNTTTYTVNVTEPYHFYYNKGKAENRTITVQGTEDMITNETVTVDTWFKALDVGLPEDTPITTPIQTLYLS